MVRVVGGASRFESSARADEKWYYKHDSAQTKSFIDKTCEPLFFRSITTRCLCASSKSDQSKSDRQPNAYDSQNTDTGTRARTHTHTLLCCRLCVKTYIASKCFAAAYQPVFTHRLIMSFCKSLIHSVTRWWCAVACQQILHRIHWILHSECGCVLCSAKEEEEKTQHQSFNQPWEKTEQNEKNGGKMIDVLQI